MERSRGFSLVEISIVIVLIAILISGVLTSRRIIKQSQLNSVVMDFSKFDVAVNSFMIKYGQLPGDFNEASEVWGTRCSATATNCDGNNDGVIDANTGPNDVEIYRAWQHLKLAEILDLNLSLSNIGLGLGTGNQANLLENVPESRVYGAGYCFNNAIYPTGFSYSSILSNVTKNYIIFAGETTNSPLNNTILTPIDALYIDNLFDDGIPGTGKIIANASGCADLTNIATAIYDTSSSSKSCLLAFEFKSQ